MTQPAFYIDRKDYDGWASSPYLFFLGWMGVLVGSLECLIWLANPFYLVAILLFVKGNKLSVILSGLATFLALLFSRLPTIPTSTSGTTSKITSFELGYKLWVTSFAILFIGAVVDIIFNIIKWVRK